MSNRITLIVLQVALWILAGIPSYAHTREVEMTDNNLRIVYEFDSLTIKSSQNEFGAMHIFLTDFAETTEPCKPRIPLKTESFSIPLGCQIKNYSVVSETDTIYGECMPTIPVEFETESSYSPQNFSNQISSYTGNWPQSCVNITSGSAYKGYGIGHLVLTPCQYNYNSKYIVFNKRIEISIDFEQICRASSRLATSCVLTSEEIASMFDIPNNLASGNIEKSIFYGDNVDGLTEAPHYVIICPTEFTSAAEKLADWKRRIGFNVNVVACSTNSLSNPQYTDSIIKNQYNLNAKLEYVLLLGGGYIIAPNNGRFSNGNNPYTTDVYFACMDGDADYVPDITIGRLPAHNLEEALTLVDKTIRYEKDPPTDNVAYFNTSLHVAQFYPKTYNLPITPPIVNPPIIMRNFDLNPKHTVMEDRHFVKTSEDIINYFSNFNILREYYADSNQTPLYWSDEYSTGEIMPVYIRKPNLSWNATPSSIVQRINSGVRYILYRGHGSITSWDRNLFSNNDVSSLENSSMLPVIFNICCLNGVFNLPAYTNTLHYDSSTYSMSETLLKQKNGGAVGIIGANQISYSGYNDYFVTAMMDAIQPNPGFQISLSNYPPSTLLNPLDYNRPPTLALGKCMNLGLKRLFEIMGNGWGSQLDNTLRYSHEIYHCLADPSLKLYTAQPIKQIPSITRVSNQAIVRDSRTVVLVDKTTNDVYLRTQGTSFNLNEYGSQYHVSLIGDNYVPYLFHETIDVPVTSLMEIPYNDYGSYISLETQDIEGEVFAECHDLSGHLFSQTSRIAGNLQIDRPSTPCIITLRDETGNSIAKFTIPANNQ